MSSASAQEFHKPTDNRVRGFSDATDKIPWPEINVGLLTGGIDRPYVFGLAIALASKGVTLDIIGSNEVDRPELHVPPRLNFLNLRGDMQPTASLKDKVARVLVYYARLIRYSWVAKPQIFHILWDNKFQLFDRIVLMLYYKGLGKKIALTAMNVNAARRDGRDSMFNRLSLRIQYHLADHFFVHTQKMKRELVQDFGIRGQAVTIIPMGVNNSVPSTDLTPKEAKQRLGIGSRQKTILFFGTIRPYKGLEHLVAAFHLIAPQHPDYRLILVGDPMKSVQYWHDIQETIERKPSRDQVIQRIEYIPDSDTEIYFKAADVIVLPYNDIFQSGVIFLSYGFGLPVIASDVGSLAEDIVEGETGFVCKPRDAIDLARAIETYFESDLYLHLDEHRKKILEYARTHNSWDVAATRTCNVYSALLKYHS